MGKYSLLLNSKGSNSSQQSNISSQGQHSRRLMLLRCMLLLGKDSLLITSKRQPSNTSSMLASLHKDNYSNSRMLQHSWLLLPPQGQHNSSRLRLLRYQLVMGQYSLLFNCSGHSNTSSRLASLHKDNYSNSRMLQPSWLLLPPHGQHNRSRLLRYQLVMGKCSLLFNSSGHYSNTSSRLASLHKNNHSNSTMLHHRWLLLPSS